MNKYFLGLLLLLMAPVSVASMEGLQRALALLDEALEEDRSINSMRVGGRIHRAVAGIWENMSRIPGSGIEKIDQFTGQRGRKQVYGFGPQMEVTYVNRRGETVTGMRPRFEVWIEKAVGAESNRIADQVIIDHQARTISVNDITARSIDDPHWDAPRRRSSAGYERTVSHEAANYDRVFDIDKQLKDLGIDNYSVTTDTPEGAYYKTHLERLRREGRAIGSEERRRRIEHSLREGPDSGGGNAARNATRALIGGILISFAIGELLPESARAEERMNSEAERNFEMIMRHYIRGEHTEADRLFRWWRHAEATIYAKQLFPTMSDGAALLFAEGYLIPYIEELRAATRDIAQRRMQCIAQENAAHQRVVTQARQRLDQAREQVRAHFESAYDDLIRRIDGWQRRLEAMSRRHGDAEMVIPTNAGRLSWSDLREFSAGIPQFRRQLLQQKAAINLKIEQATGDTIEALGKAIKEELGRSYAQYWVFLSASTGWAQYDTLAKQRADKAALRQRYGEATQALTSADDPQWQTLRDQFAALEQATDQRYRDQLAGLYQAFATETRNVSQLLDEIGGNYRQIAHGITAIDEPGSPIHSFTTQGLLVIFDALVYEHVEDSRTRYFSDEGQLTVSALPVLRQTLTQPEPQTGRVAIMAVWIDGNQAPLAELERPLKSGSTLRIWATIVPDDGAAPQDHEWPIGPPPAGGLRDRFITWYIDGSAPQQAGHTHSVILPEVSGHLAQNVTLKLSHPTARDLELHLAVRANRKPELCFSAPAEGARGEWLQIEWQAKDEDPHNPLTLEIRSARSEIEQINNASGQDTRDTLLNTDQDRIELRGRELLHGSARIAWFEPGEYIITATLSDGEDTLTHRHGVTINGNDSPRFRSSGLTPTSIAIGGEANISYSAVDGDADDEIRFFLDLPRGISVVDMDTCTSMADVNGKTCQAKIRGDEEGRYNIRIRVADEHGATDERIVNLVVGEPPINCARIDCDCANLDFGLLTGPYRQECRDRERALIERCRTNNGRGQYACDSVTSGPNPWPR